MLLCEDIFSEEYRRNIAENILPFFMELTRNKLKKGFVYDLNLEEAARKHSEAMAISRKRYHAPWNFLDGAVENIYLCSGRDTMPILVHIANGFTDGSLFSKRLIEYNRIGVGIVIVKSNVCRGYTEKDVYITQRLKPE